MIKKFVPALMAISVLALNAPAQANETDLDAAPRAAASSSSKGNLEVLGNVAGAVKDVAKGGFVDEYWKVAAEAEAKVDAIAGKDASMWKQFCTRVTHPIEICLPPVKHVVLNGFLPIVRKLFGL